MTHRPPSPLEIVFAYHEASKHHPRRFAPSPGFMDWANQPDPFRRYTGAAVVPLPLPPTEEGPPLAVLHRGVTAKPLALESVSLLLRLSLAVSAWKAVGQTRWALRCNPSSGNLHPTEGYLILPPLPGVGGQAAVYHYCPLEHTLERRCVLPAGAFDEVRESLGRGAFLVGLSSILWREAWKYGERAFRYCQHDVGHAMGALRFAAAALGWRMRVLSRAGDGEVASLLGLDRKEDRFDAEEEHPDLLLWVDTEPSSGASDPTDSLDGGALSRAAFQGVWTGVANRLSSSHQEWPELAGASVATVKPPGVSPGFAQGAPPALLPPPFTAGFHSQAGLHRLARQRRSAVDFDGKTGMSRRAFFSLMDGVMPRPGLPPFDVLDWHPTVHLLMFVHRVTGWTPGLYALPRTPCAKAGLAAALRPSFAWEKVSGAPEHLPLYRLISEDVRAIGQVVSCQQDIGGDGAFSLGMVAEFQSRVEAAGAWFYRRLFWECGLVGQALYLGAEAVGARATGIGCFFDDQMHEVLGLRGTRFQSLYHLAVGTAVEDERIATLPAYEREG